MRIGAGSSTGSSGTAVAAVAVAVGVAAVAAVAVGVVWFRTSSNVIDRGGGVYCTFLLCIKMKQMTNYSICRLSALSLLTINYVTHLRFFEEIK